MPYRSTPVPALKAGDIVLMYGGRFQILEDAHDCATVNCAYWKPGPTGVAITVGLCLDGEFPGYFQPGTIWRFQGNYRATHAVEVQQ
jgi:hypothetical protein